MYALVIGLIILCCVLLVLVILAQNAKGGGLTSQFGGSAASNIMGVKKTGDLLEKLTWGFIVAIMVLSLATNFIAAGRTGSGNDIIDRASDEAPASQPALDLPTDSETAPADTAQ